MKKKKIIVIILGLLVLVVGGFWYQIHQRYSYEWVEVKDSSIGQYRLYVNNSLGMHINGTVRIVYINGKSKRVNVDKEGLLYVKGIVAEVRNPNRR
jgi:hypothetical protein